MFHGDGVRDYRDTDSDDDGVRDSSECPRLPCRDSDGDALPDYLDIGGSLYLPMLIRT